MGGEEEAVGNQEARRSQGVDLDNYWRLRKTFLGLQRFSGNVKSGLSYLNIQIFLFIFDISIFHGRCDTRRELCINFLFLLNSVTRLYLTYFSLDQLRTALEEKDHKNFSFE